MPLDSLNFGRADFDATPPSDDCLWCTRALDGTWYTAEDARICGTCAANARAALHGDSPKLFWRSLGYGTLTAAMCGMAYSYFLHATGGSWAIVACWFVGYAIGKMMRTGSHGFGGRRYQVAAALLTYATITIGSGAALLAGAHPPVWLYPFFLIAPIFLLVAGKIQMAALMVLFLFAAIRYAWTLTAGPKLKVAGPFHAESPSA